MTNLLCETNFKTKYNTYPFSKIQPGDFLPALKKSIIEAKAILDEMKNSTATDFSSIINAFEEADDRVGLISNLFFNLHYAESNDELRDLAKEMSPILSDYGNDIQLDELIFKKVKLLHDKMETLDLSPEELTVLEETFRGFARNGALLDEQGKAKYRQITKKLAELSLHYSDNSLQDKNQFEMILLADDLVGLTEDFKIACAEAASEKGHTGKYLVNLDFPSYLPFMQYSLRPDLRKTLYSAMSAVSSQGNKYDNQKNCQEIASLRLEKANLLGYKSHAEYVLEERMAQNSGTVNKFIDELLTASMPIAKAELAEIKAYKKSKDNSDEFHPWDFNYWSRLYKQEKFGLDPEDFKPYFKLENVIKGAFTVASTLYDLDFRESDIEGYQKDVTTYEVFDSINGEFIGVFYADFFPRAGKKAGAWMTSFRDQRVIAGKDRRPHISIVCNFTKPTREKPSLLTFNEVTTLFHEFGHALHGLLSKCHFKSVSGPNVYWDFVELPSQILENWCYEKECLDLFAEHFETGEKIPAELVNKLNEARKFLEGYACVRQLSFANLDMLWHDAKSKSEVSSAEDIEKEIKEKTELIPDNTQGLKSCSFGHIFSGGYSAGYYSYKWAEVLDADAFEAFKEKGIFNKEVATKFKNEVLAKGGSEHPMTLYKRFRGKAPSVDALLRRSGFQE